MRTVMRKLTSQIDLTEREIKTTIMGIKEDRIDEVQIAGFLVALLMKGPTVEEIVAIAKTMREVCLPLKPEVNGELIDTCGTGGGFPTFNVSTAVAITTAAGGLYVAKHGSRSIAHSSGSADAFEALGVEIKLTSRQAEKLIEKTGIAFVNAAYFHLLMGKIWQPESKLGIKTVFFTIIGPLINPARARCHINGVYQPQLVKKVAQVWAKLDHKHILVVHGMDGLDEISLVGETHIAEVKDGHIDDYTIVPEDVGLKRCKIEQLNGGSPEDNAKIIRDIFKGKEKGPKKDMVILNSAGAFVAGGKVKNLKEGVETAREIIESGKAYQKLEELVKASHSINNETYRSN